MKKVKMISKKEKKEAIDRHFRIEGFRKMLKDCKKGKAANKEDFEF